ncbi:uncharacterized protein LOC130739665, partial [Lotus japonicus]|uniref:uncharacterized protein LOC130739665 n=1 Tax=Lotus japonicus TaxID=34305 RepID=UPI00258D4503
ITDTTHILTNMCSNTGSSSACGCGCVGNSGGVTMWSSSLKKQQPPQKRPRVPKRGPGVAELEKILREEEVTTINSIKDKPNGKGEGFQSSCFIPHHSTTHFSSPSLKSHSLPPPPTSPGPASRNLPPHVPRFDRLGKITPPTMTSIYGNGGSSGRNVGGSGLVSSEQELFPRNLSSCKPMPNLNEGLDGSQSDSGNSPSRNEPNPVWPYSAKRNNHYPPPAMNQLLRNGARSSSGSLPIGLNNHLEPPSNQSSYYKSSRAQEEHMMAGLKRSSHSSPLDNSLISQSTFQVPPSFSHSNKPHQSSTNGSHGAGGFNSAEGYSDKKWGSTLELSNRRFNSDIVRPGHANFPPFSAPEVTPPPMHLFQGVLSKGNVLPCQVTEDKMMEDSYQHPEPDHKPFYDFLQVKGPEDATETTHGPNHGGREAGRGGIDLNLKL